MDTKLDDEVDVEGAVGTTVDMMLGHPASTSKLSRRPGPHQASGVARKNKYKLESQRISYSLYSIFFAFLPSASAIFCFEGRQLDDRANLAEGQGPRFPRLVAP
jgi:hypothetical protein